MDSLRLLRWVQHTEGNAKSESLADLLAQWHFEMRRCVASHEVLSAAAAVVGLDASDVARVLSDPSVCRKSVVDSIERIHRRGIHAIPFFKITMRSGDRAATTTVDGALDEAGFTEALSKLESSYKEEEEGQKQMR